MRSTALSRKRHAVCSNRELVLATDLYRSIILWNEARGAEDVALAHEVWDMTPWVVDVFDSPSRDNARRMDMMLWCRDRWGEQAWWPSGRKGAWQSGSATVDGWTWWGFDDEAKMIEFATAWPSN